MKQRGSEVERREETNKSEGGRGKEDNAIEKGEGEGRGDGIGTDIFFLRNLYRCLSACLFASAFQKRSCAERAKPVAKLGKSLLHI